MLDVLPNHTVRVSPGSPDRDKTYQGYPNLSQADVTNYRSLAVEQLMGELNEYIAKRRKERGKREK